MTMDNWLTQIEVLKGSKGGWAINGHYKSGSEVKGIAHKHLKRDAVHLARGYAMAKGEANKAKQRGLELVIKDRKGVIRQKDSFGYDPRYIKG